MRKVYKQLVIFVELELCVIAAAIIGLQLKIFLKLNGDEFWYHEYTGWLFILGLFIVPVYSLIRVLKALAGYYDKEA
jgi:hypothetical protein